jgi:putative ABC transport system permease protein
MRRFVLRLFNVFRRERLDDDAAREVTSHLALLEDEHRRRGLNDREAQLAAREAMGSVALAMDLHRDARSFKWLDDARQDLRFAMRMLVRGPGFAAVVIVTMALSIGATTTLFSLVYGVLMRPLPWSEPDRLVRLQETRGGRAGRIPWTISNGTYLAWRDRPDTIEEIGGWLRSRRMTLLVGGGEPERLLVGPVTPSLMRVIRARPEVGRLFLDGDTGGQQATAVILGHGLWQRRFGGRADIVGTTLRLDNQLHTVIGVMPRDFAFPNRETEAWTPFTVVPVHPKPNVISLMIFPALARLRSGVTVPQVETEATSRARGAPDIGPTGVALFGGREPIVITAAPAVDVLTAGVRPALLVLLAAVALLFLASTTSLLVLQLSRVVRRSRETAVRAAIGAGGARLVRQWLVESGMLGAIGAAAGVLTAGLLHRALPAVLPVGFPRIEDVRLDWRVAIFAGAVALLVSAACGMVPAFGARVGRLTETLSKGRGGTTLTLTRTRAATVRTIFMAIQVAVACVLLIGGSLLTRSFVRMLDADRGFDPHNLLTMRLPLPPQSTFPKYMSTIDRLQSSLGVLPGVTDVAIGNALPLVSPGNYGGMNIALPRDPSTKVEVQAIQRVVSPEYFRAMRLRVVEGRPLADLDTVSSPPVVVVNRTFAARYLGDRPIGQRLNLPLGKNLAWEVVGVVEDMRQGTNFEEPSATFGGLTDPPQPEMFFPHRQWPAGFSISELIVVIRSAGDPALLSESVRARIAAEDPTLPIDSVMTMEDRVAASLAGPRSYAVFLVGFALCALAIAGVGLFGVISYMTSQRTREIGLRAALGARCGDVLALVGRQALAITAGGVAAGLVAAFALSRSLSILLYGISTRDVVSFAVVPLVLVVVSTLACAAPAWRATRIDPLVALRSE